LLIPIQSSYVALECTDDLLAAVEKVRSQANPNLHTLGVGSPRSGRRSSRLTGNPNAYFDAEFTALLYEFTAQIADYLATLGHTSMRTLAGLIAFNVLHCPTEMKYFAQQLFEFSESTSGDLTDPVYLAARAFSLASAGGNGIEAAMSRDNLDAVIAPSYSFASSPAAVTGYPNISVPVGLTREGKPAGIWMYSGS
jgi:amidase